MSSSNTSVASGNGIALAQGVTLAGGVSQGGSNNLNDLQALTTYTNQSGQKNTSTLKNNINFAPNLGKGSGSSSTINYTSSDPDVTQKALDSQQQLTDKFINTVGGLYDKSLKSQEGISSLFAGLNTYKATDGQGVIAETGQSKTLADKLGISREALKYIGYGVIALVAGGFLLAIIRTFKR